MNFIKKVMNLYTDGFKNMQLGKTLWLLIAIKLFIMFGILKFFVFNETLSSKFTTDEAKSSFVINNLLKEN